ncbi:FAD-dependent monooxygenase [Labedaea rhizosphaerae]|uniref:2-polyprenyl-6-methoxyphenol hydroxylase-like FAD-dependent oxidoreductase n=1 Tax=Labedaea rhizosphaerae TaxID=598644 RepID=A0A4V3CZM1_LABRH|nr:FAD-dependent monooxygenase [Labedaea rhizosphaerae]TDQ00291.1 2-polyprenyl-6-methoxyphenol hydroxylase-like FAD-dependent oxidoreductase [Labedaea rhizosphaerae]
MTFEPDVLIAGAGPTGLMLAHELQLSGVDTVVVERLAERPGWSKALNLQPRTAELLELRGLLDRMRDDVVTTLPAGHFAGMELDYRELDTTQPWQLGIPQARVEAHLEAALASPVWRERTVEGFVQDDTGVTVTVDGSPVRARYLVGCDGGRSTVRKRAGVPFPGRDGRVSGVVADVVLADGPTGDWTLPALGTGPMTVLPLGDGAHRVLIAGAEQQVPRDTPITDDEVRRGLGEAHELVSVRWASRFTDATRLVERYREGRVLFAGDAAHIHLPAGGQGLNLGLQEAVNLGWKLAATVRGWAPDGLLDTYNAERHPVAARVLAAAQAQGVLMVPDPDVVALRGVVEELIRAAGPAMAERVAGLDVRYPIGGSHPLTGRRLPPVDRISVTGPGLGAGRGVLIGPSPVPRGWEDRVDHAKTNAALPAVLVRPDAHIAWVEGDGPLTEALARWFGGPVT